MKKLVLSIFTISILLFATTANAKNFGSNNKIKKKVVQTCFAASCIVVCRSGGPSSDNDTIEYLIALQAWCDRQTGNQ